LKVIGPAPFEVIDRLYFVVGPVPWTIRELAEGTGAHATTIGDTLPRIAGVERAGWAVFPGASGRTARAQLWRLKL
jgi:hypothetical protein